MSFISVKSSAGMNRTITMVRLELWTRKWTVLMLFSRADLWLKVSCVLMVSLLPLHPGDRPPRSYDTPGGPGHVAIHPQWGSSQAAGQEPADFHSADHQADSHRSAGVWGHPAASPRCTTALRLHQCQRRKGWVYVHTHIHTPLQFP